MFPMLRGSDLNFDNIQHTFSHLFREENVQSSTVFMTFLYYIMVPNNHAFNKSTKSCRQCSHISAKIICRQFRAIQSCATIKHLNPNYLTHYIPLQHTITVAQSNILAKLNQSVDQFLMETLERENKQVDLNVSKFCSQPCQLF